MRPHGARELAQDEPGFYFAGMKSYGRAPTFLMLTGYEQVRSIAADIAGDHEAAARVELVLPETGVCSRAAAPEAAACCGGPAPAEVNACCVDDAKAKQEGKAGCGCASIGWVRLRLQGQPLSWRCAWGSWAACCRMSSCRRFSPDSLFRSGICQRRGSRSARGVGCRGLHGRRAGSGDPHRPHGCAHVLIAGSALSAFATFLFGFFAQGLWSGRAVDASPALALPAPICPGSKR